MSTRRKKVKVDNFLKRCKCDIHTQVCGIAEHEPSRVYKIGSSNDYSRASLNHLLSLNLISQRATYICNLCINHGRVLIEKSTNSNAVADEMEDSSNAGANNDGDDDDGTDDKILDLIAALDNVILKLKAVDNFSNAAVKEKLCEVVGVIGRKVVRENVIKDGKIIATLYKDIKYFQDLTPRDYILERDPICTSFINGITGINLNTSNDLQDLFTYAVVIESIYHLKTKNFILPYSFMMNLIQTFISGSKTVTTINGKILSGGSDTSYRKWLTSNAKPLTFPNEDSDIFIDNVGKYIVKSYRVKHEKNSTPTVVTAVINIPLMTPKDNATMLQKDEHLKPIHWMPDCPDEEKLQELMKESMKDGIADFRQMRYNYIAQMFSFLSTSHDMEVKVNEEIVTLSTPSERVCDNYSCRKTYHMLKRKCDVCGDRVSKSEDVVELSECKSKLPKYFHIGELVSNPAKITMMEPIMVNPNSYLTVKSILNEIHENLILKGEKKWCFLGADGPPYCLMRRIIEENTGDYDWVSIVSGIGHLNMNQLKTFFAICDGVCFDVLGKDVLNFTTPKAYKYFLDCKDNHKTWQSFEVFLHGTVMELIHLYCSEVEGEPSPLGFLNWQADTKSPTLHFLCELIFNVGLGIYVQQIGDRNNDCKTSHAGRMTFLSMFFAFNHPIYREVEYNELRNKIMYPESVRSLRNQNLSFTEGSGEERNHQGGDFMLEQRVKRMKMMSPKGVMSKSMWQRVARTLDDVDVAVRNGMSLLHISEGDEYRVRFTSIEKEIVKWRGMLRHSNYLHASNTRVVNIHGEILNESLEDFSFNANAKMELYFEMAKSTKLQNIRYSNLNVKSNDIMEEIQPYYEEVESDTEL